MALVVESLVVGPFGVNAYLVGEPESRSALLIDPGADLEALARLLEKTGFTLAAIVNTHAHIDHVGAVAEAKRRFGAPYWLHEADKGLLGALPVQAMMFGFPAPEVPEVDRWLNDGDALELGKATGRVIHTPGHSPGGCCLYFPDDKLVFTGDTLFRGSIGRTDLPGGSDEEIARSIRERLFTLGDEITFYPGHGPSGLIGEQRLGNPYVR
ncbi:MAG: MBL fold metallo-hydrolase [Myxococcales bacterium]|jgi:hydroxyacylglutathione hydrolase